MSEKNSLKMRVFTAVVLLPLLISAILWLPFLYFAIALGLLILVGAWEWSALIGLTNISLRVFYIILIAMGLLGSAFINIIWILSVASLTWLWIFISVIHYQRGGSGLGFQLPFVRFFAGLPILIATWVSIMALESHPNFGPLALLFVLIIIFSADTGAYFSGRFFGKRLLCSRVSPKKNMGRIFGRIDFIFIYRSTG